MKKLIRRMKKHGKRVLFIWNIIAALILFVILSPVFLKAHETTSFYLITFCLTAILVGLVGIVRQPMKKAFKDYVTHALYYVVSGAILLGIEYVFPYEALLYLSAIAYSIGLARLGFRYMFGVI